MSELVIPGKKKKSKQPTAAGKASDKDIMTMLGNEWETNKFSGQSTEDSPAADRAMDELISRHERYAANGQIIEYVSNIESVAMAALAHETGIRDGLWNVFLSYALSYDWDGWAARQPLPRPVYFTPTHTLVERALGRRIPSKAVNIDGRQLNDASLVWLCEALVLRQELNMIDLSFNQFGSRGIRFLANALRHASLVGLSLGNNNLGDRGCEELGALLASEDCQIERLNLSRNSITDAGCAHLAEALAKGSKSLTSLSLTNNPEITDAGRVVLEKALSAENGFKVSQLDFRGCGVTGTETSSHGKEISFLSDTGTLQL